MRYWLFKSEPDCFSLSDLRKKKRAPWDGVRNFQARNYLRDDVHVGDIVVFYHSSCAVPGAVGLATVTKAAYPDATAWDPHSEHPDPKSTRANPRWFVVDVAYKQDFKVPVPLTILHTLPEFAGSPLIQRGNRLSIIPLTASQFRAVVREGSRAQ